MKAEKKIFGQLDGQDVYGYRIRNSNGVEVECMEYGCAITRIVTPDRDGRVENIVLGCRELEDYIHRVPYFGAVVGRVGGRIGKGHLPVNRKTYQVTANQEGNHLHGGEKGFSHRVWSSHAIESEQDAAVVFTYFSPDGEEGFPGNLEVKVTYRLTEKNEFILTYEGRPDRDTVLNMTNHTYFNLSGSVKDSIAEHALTLPSGHYLELDDESLPTGRELETEGTVFDFRQGRKLKDGIFSDHEQIKIAGGGYDHPFLLDEGKEMILYEANSGRLLTVETDQPAVIVYTSNSMGDDIVLQEGKTAEKHMAVCLETQFPPDAVHHDSFPSIILRNGEKYHAETKWTFSVR
ncbi:aldose epimerase family protein [Metabacillus sp. FJAT-52054]|uniref:Aldose 1-epimerase n=1 Tax=Metabacillus sediminis TaxID=3117746 RepID=A0ABZ2NL07_9BACI